MNERWAGHVAGPAEHIEDAARIGGDAVDVTIWRGTSSALHA
jgi:hypothetical protein